jgi:hypothetical protein
LAPRAIRAPAATQTPSAAHGSTGDIVAGGRSTDVRSVRENHPSAVDTSRSLRHPLPWRNTPSGGENHLTDANGQSVYDGPDAAEMFRLYGHAAQAAARLDADHARPGFHSARARPAGLATRLRRLLHRR